MWKRIIKAHEYKCTEPKKKKYLQGKNFIENLRVAKNIQAVSPNSWRTTTLPRK